MHSNKMKVEMTSLWVDADSSNINLNQFAFTPQFGGFCRVLSMS